MMHRCNSCHGNMVGSCSCGFNSFSMFFSMPNQYEYDDHEENVYGYNCPSPSSVDCTLSLGTPSTRLTNENDKKQRRSSFFDVFRSKHSSSSSSSASTPKSHRGNGGNAANSGGDPLSARRCANCDTTSTPLWRNGPRGPKSLCNACGIRFKKEERRATAAAATNGGGGGAAAVVDTQHMINSSWVHHHHHSQAPQRIPCFSSSNYGNEFSFIQDNQHDADASMPFYSWHLNVPDSHRPGLVHDYTR